MAGPFVYEQAVHLAKQGCQVDVIAPHFPGSPLEERVEGVRVHRVRYVIPERWQTLCYGHGIPHNLRHSWWAKAQLPLLLLALWMKTAQIARGCDLIHAHWSIAGLAALLAGKLTRKPVALTMHGAELYVLKSNPWLRFILEHVDWVICNSVFTQARALAFSTPKQCDLIPPGVDMERFNPAASTSAFFDKLGGAPGEQPLILAIGRLVERKGFAYLIDALALLPAAPAPVLLIRGSGPLRQSLEARAQANGVAQRMKFLDYVPDEDLPGYYAAADVFVLPAIIDAAEDTEGLGVVLLEALACGTPCVASAVGGITDIIQDNVTGLLVQPGDARALADGIARLLQDKTLRQQLSQTGRAHVTANFSWQAQTEKLQAVYARLVHD